MNDTASAKTTTYPALSTKEHSLFSLVLWQVLPAAVLILLLIWFAISTFVRQLVLDAEQEKIALEAQNIAQSVEGRLDTLVGGTAAIANNQLAVNALIDTVGRNAYVPAFVRSLRLPFEANPKITLTDYRGRVIAANHEHDHIDPKPWLDSVMSGDNYLSLDHHHLTIAQPIRYNGLPEGAILVQFPASEYANIFKVSTVFLEVSVQHQDIGDLYSQSANAEADTAWLSETRQLAGYPKFSISARKRRSCS